MFRLFTFLFFIISLETFSQIQAKAISYAVEIDLRIFSPDYAEQSESEIKVCTFEVDAYFTNDRLKTITRVIQRPNDFDLSLRQRYYEINSKDEYNIDPKQEYIILRKNQVTKPKSTGKKKEVLGHKCAEYTFTDYRGIKISAWVAEKLNQNICPAGNYSLKGTVLELTASNGIHYMATDFAEGQLAADFFDLPKNYQQETVDLAAKK